MRLEYIERVKSGDVLGKNILTGRGRTLLRCGVTLNDIYINRLERLGINYVYIEDERFDDIDHENDELSQLKQSVLVSMNNIVKSVKNSRWKNLNKSFEQVDELIDYIINSKGVITNLYDIQSYDNCTYLHSINTCIMALFLAKSTNRFSMQRLVDLGKGGILHDIGKTKINYKISNKKGPLTKEEYAEMKKHTIYGKLILERNPRISEDILKIVEQHHERVDGTGYPCKLKGNEISDLAKIVCICDVYDAVSNDRNYRKKFSPSDAYELILAGNGTMFDSSMVSCFKDTFSVYPLGSCVKLSNGVEGYVVRQNARFPDRPEIRVVYDSITRDPIIPFEFDLLEYPNVVIEKIL